MIKRIAIIFLYAAMTLPLMATSSHASTHANAAVKAPKSTICMINSGDVGKLKYKANSYQMAFQKVTDACFQKRNDLYKKSRKQEPTQDRQIQFAESCVNSIKCV